MTFVREKQIYCGEEYLEIDLYNYTGTEREIAQGGLRGKKEILSTPRQIDLNEEASRRKFTQVVNTNFKNGDFHVTLSYADENIPATVEGAMRDLENYIRRLNYRLAKDGKAPLKYISIPACVFKSDGVTPARVHHHIIMSCNLDTAVIIDTWRKRRKKGQKQGDKIGRVNADIIQTLDDEYGLAALCTYLSKQAGGKKRWRPSHGLEQPLPDIIDSDGEQLRLSFSANLEKPVSVTNNRRFSRKEVEKIAKAPLDVAYWEKRYPGYTVVKGDYGFKSVYSDLRGWAVYLKMRRVRE
ncbi:MAG: hypothetical protein FWH20_00440 [Oscillospiraceae bacterium]|nr:hypothetical protein [Oscillospiraceae bacterium]